MRNILVLIFFLSFINVTLLGQESKSSRSVLASRILSEASEISVNLDSIKMRIDSINVWLSPNPLPQNWLFPNSISSELLNVRALSTNFSDSIVILNERVLNQLIDQYLKFSTAYSILGSGYSLDIFDDFESNKSRLKKEFRIKKLQIKHVSEIASEFFEIELDVEGLYTYSENESTRISKQEFVDGHSLVTKKIKKSLSKLDSGIVYTRIAHINDRLDSLNELFDKETDTIVFSDNQIKLFREIDSDISSLRRKVENEFYTLKPLEEALNSIPPDFDFNRFVLSRLLSIDQSVNYDTTWLKDRLYKAKKWLFDTKLNEAIVGPILRLTGDGKFEMNFYFAFESMNHHDIGASWGQLKSSFRESKGISFTDKLFYKLVHLFRVKPQDLSITIRSHCLTEHYFYHEGRITLDAIACASGSSSATIDSLDLKKITESTTGPSKEVMNSDQTPEVSSLFVEYFDNYIKSKSIDDSQHLKKIKVDDAEVILYLNDVRKEVLENLNFWENVQYTFKVTKYRNELFLTLITDAEYASGAVLWGLGSPPSYTSYESIEPKYANQLQIYTSDFLTRFIEQIKKK